MVFDRMKHFETLEKFGSVSVCVAVLLAWTLITKIVQWSKRNLIELFWIMNDYFFLVCELFASDIHLYCNFKSVIFGNPFDFVLCRNIKPTYWYELLTRAFHQFFAFIAWSFSLFITLSKIHIWRPFSVLSFKRCNYLLFF